MKRILPLFFLMTLAFNSMSQDVGIERLIYPNKPLSVYELTSYVPVYWQIKNYGTDTISNRVFTLGLYAGGSSPKYNFFRGDMEVGQSLPLDPRNPAYYNYGFHKLVGMEGVMSFITPEYAPGDTIEICLEATVEGDVNRTNDTLCFKIILAERPSRDLVVHILDPVHGQEINPNHTVSFDISLRNDGMVTYTKDSIYGQMAIGQGNKTLDLVSIATALPKNIKPGDSAVVVFDIPLSNDFPLGEVFFGFRMSWMSEDGFYEMGEDVMDNNIRYVTLNSLVSSVSDNLREGIFAYNTLNEIIVAGDFAQGEKLNLQLFDLQGKVVYSQNVEGIAGNGFAISTKNLAEGLYILGIEQNDQLVYREKIFVK